MTYLDIIQEYEKNIEEHRLNDEFLDTPRSKLPLIGEFRYGVIYMRDDAVDILIKRIKELEH